MTSVLKRGGGSNMIRAMSFELHKPVQQVNVRPVYPSGTSQKEDNQEKWTKISRVLLPES